MTIREKSPAFQWYPKDCDTDEAVRAMDDREFGFYMRCLNHAWINSGLPVDPAELMRVMGRPSSYIKSVWVRVSKCFSLSHDSSRLINRKQEEYRVERNGFVESRRTAAASRWHKQVDSTCNARAVRTECSASASSSASAKDTPPTPSSVDEAFARIWERHPKKTGRVLAEQAFAQILGESTDPGEVAEHIESSHEAWAGCDDWRKQNGQFAPKLSNWLRDGGYLDPAPESAQPASGPQVLTAAEFDRECKARWAREAAEKAKVAGK